MTTHSMAILFYGVTFPGIEGTQPVDARTEEVFLKRGVVLDYHQSEKSPSPYLAIEESVKRVHFDCPLALRSVWVGDDWDERIKQAVKQLVLDDPPSEVGWWIVLYVK